MLKEQPLQVRVTGVFIQDGEVLVVKQTVSPARAWSLPGGRLQHGESLRDAMVREMREETGLETEIVKLLYVCDKPETQAPVLHISFLLWKTGGELRLPSNDLEQNPIHDVRMVPTGDLPRYGFSRRFTEIIQQGFPGAGGYVGPKASIGL